VSEMKRRNGVDERERRVMKEEWERPNTRSEEERVRNCRLMLQMLRNQAKNKATYLSVHLTAQ
jgi:hypothetical protein